MSSTCEMASNSNAGIRAADRKNFVLGGLVVDFAIDISGAYCDRLTFALEVGMDLNAFQMMCPDLKALRECRAAKIVVSGILDADVEIVFVCESNCIDNMSSSTSVDDVFSERLEVASIRAVE